MVRSSNEPEAGVWIIAETDALLTPFVTIVVTNDEGRFLLPDLPRGTYNVWVRGYGLVDATAVRGTLGQNLILQAVVALTPEDAPRFTRATTGTR